MEIITDIEQGSKEWHELRFGWITASRFKDVIAKGQGKTRMSYMREIAAEILTNERQEGYSNEYMDWGTETEPQARAMYELENAVTVDQVTFIRHGKLKAGCSPDGLVGDDGLIEIKCPKTTTQIDTFLGGKMPSYHKPQVQGQLWISKRKWTDFISFDPRINGESSYFCIRVFRDEEYIEQLASEVAKFETELLDMIEKLK